MGKAEVKKFILDYIEKKTDPEDLWTMSRKEILGISLAKFKEEDYKEKEIESLIDEVLEEEGKHLIHDEVSFEIIYPRNKSKQVKEFWRDQALLGYDKNYLVFISYGIIFFVTVLFFPGFLLQVALSPIFLLLIYLLLVFTYKNFEKGIKLINNGVARLSISYAIGALISLIVLLLINHFVSEISVSIIVASEIGATSLIGGFIFKLLELKQYGKK